MKVKVKVAQLCPTLCDPMGYTVHGILQARILEWVAFPFSRGSSLPRDWTQISHIGGTSFPAEPQGKSGLICDHVIFVMAASLGYLPFRWGGWSGGGIPCWTQQKSGWGAPVCMEVPVLDSERHQCFQSVLQDSVRWRYFKKKMFLIGISLKKFWIKKAKWSLFICFLQWHLQGFLVW